MLVFNNIRPLKLKIINIIIKRLIFTALVDDYINDLQDNLLILKTILKNHMNYNLINSLKI